jgi:hypothetical protein
VHDQQRQHIAGIIEPARASVGPHGTGPRVIRANSKTMLEFAVLGCSPTCRVSPDHIFRESWENFVKMSQNSSGSSARHKVLGWRLLLDTKVPIFSCSHRVENYVAHSLETAGPRLVLSETWLHVCYAQYNKNNQYRRQNPILYHPTSELFSNVVFESAHTRTP